MAYRFRSDETIEAGVRRVAAEQARRALTELGDPALSPSARAFGVRKRCKKVRSLVRLVRPVFEAYDTENAAYRDISRGLAVLRDAAAVLEAFDALTEQAGNDGAFAELRESLAARLEPERTSEGASALDSAREALEAAAKRIETWSVAGEGFGAFGEGLRSAYERSRRAMRHAEQEPTAERLHEWRTRLKHDRAHTRLLTDLWGPAEPSRLADAKTLSDTLGFEHDLGELSLALQAAEIASEELDAMIDAKRAELRERAFEIGHRLYAEKPGRYADRVEERWGTWRG